MDDQGRSDMHCRSFVLQSFDSLLPFLSTGGFPYLPARKVGQINKYSLLVQCFYPAGFRPPGISMLGRDVGSQNPSPCWGACYLTRLTLQTFSPEPLEVLFRKDLKKNVRS